MHAYTWSVMANAHSPLVIHVLHFVTSINYRSKAENAKLCPAFQCKKKNIKHSETTPFTETEMFRLTHICPFFLPNLPSILVSSCPSLKLRSRPPFPSSGTLLNEELPRQYHLVTIHIINLGDSSLQQIHTPDSPTNNVFGMDWKESTR